MIELFLILERMVLHIVAGLTMAFLAVAVVTGLFLLGLLVLGFVQEELARRRVRRCKCIKGEVDGTD